MEDRGVEQQQKLVMLLRSRNHKGETCLHEAVRRDNALLVMSLILVDEMNDDKSSLLPLVRRVDYEGVSPLYLAATLCRSDIVEILTHENNKYIASFSGSGGKTALHAAVLWNKGY
jgi:ankyrin repeat protein